MDLNADEIAALEQQWIGRVQIDQPSVYFDWQPAPVPLFTSLLEACLPHVPPGNRTFLDAGCGIGTKCLLAVSYGLAAYGIDRVPEYLAEAASLGVSTEQTLIESYTGYSTHGLVYLNHPLVCGGDCDDEAVLAHGIQVQMASGAVLLSVNYDLAPGCLNPRHAGAVVPCDDSCTKGYISSYDEWTEVARSGDWNAAWVKQ